MKNKQNEHPFDCRFEYEGETIGVRVMPDNKPIKTIRGVEMMSGFFYFYDINGYCGAEPFYEDFDNMKPVRPEIAKQSFIDMKKRK